MDTRIQYLEEDAFYFHNGDNWENEDNPNTSLPFNTHQVDLLGWTIPTEQTNQISENSFSYQWKRPVFDSPECTDIQREQHSLHTRIDQMGHYLENITESLSQFTKTQFPNQEYETPTYLLNHELHKH